jgi:hypothetical protein
MPRKTLATLLILFWILLSGVDLLQGFDLGVSSSVHKSKTDKRSPLSNLAQVSSVLNDTIEQSNRTVVTTITPSDALPTRNVMRDLSGQATKVQKKNLQLFKRHGAFLI